MLCSVDWKVGKLEVVFFCHKAIDCKVVLCSSCFGCAVLYIFHILVLSVVRQLPELLECLCLVAFVLQEGCSQRLMLSCCGS